MDRIIQSFIQLFGIDWVIIKLSSDIYELYEKTISVGQIIAVMHKILGIRLSSTERSQLHELRKKIRRYQKLLNYFGVWGQKFDGLFKILVFGLKEKDADNLEYIVDKPDISGDKRAIGVDFYTHDIEILKKSLLRFQIWDISRYQKFQVIRQQYYRGAAAAIIFFYADDDKSINLMGSFIAELKEITNLKFTPRKMKKVTIDMPIALVALGSSEKELSEKISTISKEVNSRYFDFDEITFENFGEIFKFITSQLII
jgi:GTPase SAR1 family protein